jgi:protein-tyrosine phosphatase
MRARPITIPRAGSNCDDRQVARILHVCLANRARSPLAELIMVDELARRGVRDIEVASAGVRAVPDQPMWGPAAAEAERRGLDGSRFRSYRLTREMAEDADLVLAATRALRDDAISAAPAVMRRAFTWLEVVRLLDGVSSADLSAETPAHRLRILPGLLAARRGIVPPVAGERLDLPDPVDQPPEFLPTAADTLSVALTRLLDVLVPPREPAR